MNSGAFVNIPLFLETILLPQFASIRHSGHPCGNLLGGDRIHNRRLIDWR